MSSSYYKDLKVKYQHDYKIIIVLYSNFSLNGRFFIWYKGRTTPVIADIADIADITNGNPAITNNFYVKMSSHRSNTFPCKVSIVEDGKLDCIVVINGWVGSSDRHLQKYSSLWHSLGVKEVWRHTAETFDVFVSSRNLRRLTENLLLDLAKYSESKPIYLMYFSNGGAFVHEQIIDILREDSKLPVVDRRFSHLKIAATIFDSCPAPLTIDSGSKALSEGFRNPIIRFVAYYAASVFICLMALLFYGISRPRVYEQNITSDPLPCPNMYIYSDYDIVTDSKLLANIIDRRRQAHVSGASKVIEYRITDVKSPHCAHLITIPEKYQMWLATLLEDTYEINLS